jgi:hypothetical protein
MEEYQRARQRAQATIDAIVGELWSNPHAPMPGYKNLRLRATPGGIVLERINQREPVQRVHSVNTMDEPEE